MQIRETYTFDYYPFGMLMSGRQASSTAYKYGFNGQEKDDEVKGAGNEMNFEGRILDTRLGRWFSTDPQTFFFPQYSPYHFAGDCPIMMGDKDGEVNTVYIYINPNDVMLTQPQQQDLINKLVIATNKVNSANPMLNLNLQFLIVDKPLPQNKLDKTDAMIIIANKEYFNSSDYDGDAGGESTTDPNKPIAIYPNYKAYGEKNDRIDEKGNWDYSFKFYPNFIDKMAFTAMHEYIHKMAQRCGFGNFKVNPMQINKQNGLDHDLTPSTGLMIPNQKEAGDKIQKTGIKNLDNKYFLLSDQRFLNVNKNIGNMTPTDNHSRSEGANVLRRGTNSKRLPNYVFNPRY